MNGLKINGCALYLPWKNHRRSRQIIMLAIIKRSKKIWEFEFNKQTVIHDWLNELVLNPYNCFFLLLILKIDVLDKGSPIINLFVNKFIKEP